MHLATQTDGAPPAQPTQNQGMSELTTFSEALVNLVAAASPSVVAVKAGAYKTVSGVVLDAEHIAVPEHALRRRESIPFVTQAGDTAEAKILGRDPGVDLAILQCPGIKASPLQTANPESLKAGMLAAVIGMTRDAGPSVSLGILGAVGAKRNTWRGGVLDHFLRLDVNLYPSQNGAAVISSEGQLLGMATPALSRHSTITVPISTMLRIITELQTEGRIRLGYLGVGVQPVVIPEHLREKVPGAAERALILLNVVSGAAADQAGLQLGDILLTLNAQTLEDVDQLQAQLRGDHIGRPSELIILRGGEPRKFSIVIQEAVKKQD
jgi:S1-C subfamily serine protease